MSQLKYEKKIPKLFLFSYLKWEKESKKILILQTTACVNVHHKLGKKKEKKMGKFQHARIFEFICNSPRSRYTTSQPLHHHSRELSTKRFSQFHLSLLRFFWYIKNNDSKHTHSQYTTHFSRINQKKIIFDFLFSFVFFVSLFIATAQTHTRMNQTLTQCIITSHLFNNPNAAIR